MLTKQIKEIKISKVRGSNSEVFNHRAEIDTHEGEKLYMVLGSQESFLAKLDMVQRQMGLQPTDFVPVKYVNDQERQMQSFMFNLMFGLVGLGAFYSIFKGRSGGIGGKAGKTQFVIQVGEVANLYKTTKPSARSSSSKTRRDDIMIDLHGLKEEALQKLNESLPGWVDTAMKGEHPWVIPVKIVVGGGNQILADAVEDWIRTKDSVSNAPKNLYE